MKWTLVGVACLMLTGCGEVSARAELDRTMKEIGEAQTTDSVFNASGWYVSYDTSDMTRQPGVHLRYGGVRPNGLGRAAHLVVRCHEKRLVAFVASSERLEDDGYGTRVRLRWDRYPAIRATWSRSTDGTAAFASDVDGFVNDGLAVAESLYVEIQPVAGAPIVTAWQVTGFREHIPALKAACPHQIRAPSADLIRPVKDSG